MKDDRVDLSCLDPTLDRERWEGLVRQVVQQSQPRRSLSELARQLLAWRLPSLALGASFSLATWLVVIVPGAPKTSEVVGDTWVLSGWVAPGTTTSVPSLIGAFLETSR